MALVFRREYNTRLGWTHNFRERITPEADGSLTWRDDHGISWRFAPDSASGVWLPPPKLFQRVVSHSERLRDAFQERARS